MKKKNRAICTLIVLTPLLVMVNIAAGAAQNQQEQFAAIEKYISQRQQEIEDFYSDRLLELQLRAEKDRGLLEVADKGSYAPLIEQAKTAETVLNISDYGHIAALDKYKHEPYHILKNRNKNAPKQFAIAQSKIAIKKNEVKSSFEWSAAEIELQKKYALTVALKELEKRLKENMTETKPKVMQGTVTGIVYSREGPSAIIAGKIVHEGESVHKIKVAKIARNKVAFEKNGRSWEQKVQQMPAAEWQ